MSVLEELKKKISDIETQSLAMDGCRPTFTVDEILDLIDSVESDKQTEESTQNVPNSELISKKAAIDAINTWDKFGVDERCRLVRWHEGLEPYVHLRDVLISIANLPSAQPEIIYCRECEKYGTMFCAMDTWTEQVTIHRAKPDDFCSRAERREG